MDKKNTTIGVLLLIAAFAALFLSQRFAPPPPPAPEVGQASGPSPMTGSSTPATPITSPGDAVFAALAGTPSDAQITTLANDHVELRLTEFGGAIRDVAFKQFPAQLESPEPFIFNQAHVDPILGFTSESFPTLGRDAKFTRVSASPTEVVFRATFENRVEVTRRYVLRATGDTSGDPYVVQHETTFRNLTTETQVLPRAALSLGTTALVSSNDNGLYLNITRYDGEDTHVKERTDLEGGSGFLGIGASSTKTFIDDTGPAVWGAVKNQFFVSAFVPSQPGVGVIARRVELPPLPGSNRTTVGMTGALRLDLPTLAPGASATLAGDLYVGPKEYTRLAKLPSDLDRVMQFDRYFFNRIFLSGYVAPLMNTLMNWMHGFVGQWGVAIVLMTLFLKVITLPFTLAAARSAKRMAKLQPEMQAIREKYKDNPKKLNEATLALFTTHKINPAGGCIPILITIPLFVGFFAMLQGSAELRFQPFLWAPDLAAPDTIVRFSSITLGGFLPNGIPINIMPLLMGATMVFQMRLTPTPSVDNMQAKIFKFMPFLFTAFCYNFSCGLALYSTINGLFTIGQQLVINRMKDKDDPAPGTPAKPAPAAPLFRRGKPVKNVTPKK